MDGFRNGGDAEILVNDVRCEDTIGDIRAVRHCDGRVEVTVGQHSAFVSGPEGAEGLRIEIGQDRTLVVAVDGEEKWSLPLSRGECERLGGPDVMCEISGPEPSGPRF